jgi:hypothetical protein
MATGMRAPAIVAALILATTLPLAGKAFHIDEVYYVEVAQNILKDPLRPFAGAVGLEDIDYRVFDAAGRCPDTFTGMEHPPLVPYVMALIAWFAGRFSEPWLHVAFVPFALGAGLAMHSLARRFTPFPLAATLLLVTCPIFTLSAQSLMTDMPTLAFALGALSLVIEGIDHERPWQVTLAGALAGLAMVTRYASVMVIPLLLLYGFSQGRLRKALPSLFGVAAVFGVWAGQNLAYHGRLHILASIPHYRLFYAGQSFDWAGLLKKALGDLTSLGGVSLAAAGLLLLVGTWRRWLAFGVASLTAAAVFWVRPRSIERLDTYSAIEVAAVAGCFGLGAVLLAEAPRPSGNGGSPPQRQARLSDQAVLTIWLLMAVLGAILFLPFATARYMLPILPPLFLLLVRRAGAFGLGERALRLVGAIVVGQGLLLGTLLSLADFEYADCYRHLATSLRASYPSRAIWFVGEWGFRHYMRAAGGRYLRSTYDAPRAGDIIVRPSIAGMHEMSAGVRRRAERVAEIDLPGRWPVRVMSFQAKAGYYSHHWGFLPFAFSQRPLESVEVFEVRASASEVKTRECASY